ncbi:MAG: NUMOD3 domain-containing DNA-binding protein [Candidatus Paceibacterota bacterium]
MEFKYEGKSLKSGVYKITNTQNGRVYFGSAKEFKERWKHHAKTLIQQKHHNRFLQADFLKCGASAFVFEVVEIVEGDKLARTTAEQVFVNRFFDTGKQCYNLKKDTACAQGSMPGCSEETKRKIGEAARGRKLSLEARENIRQAALNRSPEAQEKINEGHKNMSPETKEKMVELGKLMAQKNLKKVQELLTGKPLSTEHRQKLSEAHKGNRCSDETRLKMSKVRKGKTLSKERRHKISLARKQYWANK